VVLEAKSVACSAVACNDKILTYGGAGCGSGSGFGFGGADVWYSDEKLSSNVSERDLRFC
jgi:hypothetical protein